jgi:pimeloyl-ACP methyl ester carboxylesterase
MITEKSFDSDDTRINYAECPDNGPPLVLLHGTLNRWQAFLPIMPSLMHRWHIYAPDFRGHGKSHRASRYGFDDYVNDIVRFVLGVVKQPAVIFGHSLGGRVALKIADIQPSLTRAIILGDSSMKKPVASGGMGASFNNLIKIIEENHSVIDIYNAILNIEANEYDHTLALTRAKNLSMVDPAMIRSIISHPDPSDPNSHFYRYDPDKHLVQVKCPTLILRAERGMLSEEEVQKALRVLPEAYLVTLKDVPHEFLTQQAEPVVKALNAFLESII